jgi:hypothetical protein
MHYEYEKQGSAKMKALFESDKKKVLENWYNAIYEENITTGCHKSNFKNCIHPNFLICLFHFLFLFYLFIFFFCGKF